MTSKKIFSLARHLSLKWANDKKTMLPPPPEDFVPATIRDFEDSAPTMKDPSLDKSLLNMVDFFAKEDATEDEYQAFLKEQDTLVPEDDVYLQETEKTLIPANKVDAAVSKFTAKYSFEK